MVDRPLEDGRLARAAGALAAGRQHERAGVLRDLEQAPVGGDGDGRAGQGELDLERLPRGVDVRNGLEPFDPDAAGRPVRGGGFDRVHQPAGAAAVDDGVARLSEQPDHVQPGCLVGGGERDPVGVCREELVGERHPVAGPTGVVQLPRRPGPLSRGDHRDDRGDPDPAGDEHRGTPGVEAEVVPRAAHGHVVADAEQVVHGQRATASGRLAEDRHPPVSVVRRGDERVLSLDAGRHPEVDVGTGLPCRQRRRVERGEVERHDVRSHLPPGRDPHPVSRLCLRHGGAVRAVADARAHAPTPGRGVSLTTMRWNALPSALHHRCPVPPR